MKDLPDWRPLTRDVVNPGPPFKAKPYGGGIYPPIQKLDDGSLVVDWWTGGWSDPSRVTVRVWVRADHPNAKLLPANAPRIVKALYSASGQLAYLRGNMEQLPAALDAWNDYNAFLNNRRPT